MEGGHGAALGDRRGAQDRDHKADPSDGRRTLHGDSGAGLARSGDPIRGRGERTRHSILMAAIERFGRDGYRATSVADIARDAGCGPTVPYAYFRSKEDLFLAALDEDAAGVVEEALVHLNEMHDVPDWGRRLFATLISALQRHPLARRVLAGLEPSVTAHVPEIPVLSELRKVCTERLRDDQMTGRARADIDAQRVADGLVTIVLSLLMSVVQLGTDLIATYADGIDAVFAAATEPHSR